MVFFYVVGAFAAVVASFVAGAIYGRNAERSATAKLRSILDGVDKKFN